MKPTQSLAMLICVFFCSMQINQILQEFFTPTKTRTFVEETQLQNLPLNIKICVTPGFNDKALQQYGYKSLEEYAVGAVESNMTFISWVGHTNKSVMSSSSAKELLEAARINGIDHLRYILVFTNKDGNTNGFKVNRSELSLTRENHLSGCHVMNMAEVERLTATGIKGIGIQFDGTGIKKNNLSVVVELQGKTLAAARSIGRHKFYHVGDAMDQFASNYIVKIKKSVFIEEDPSNTCQHYPNKVFATYRDCDEKNMMTLFNKIIGGLNVTPPWLTNNLSSVTEVTYFVFQRKNHNTQTI